MSLQGWQGGAAGCILSHRVHTSPGLQRRRQVSANRLRRQASQALGHGHLDVHQDCGCVKEGAADSDTCTSPGKHSTRADVAPMLQVSAGCFSHDGTHFLLGDRFGDVGVSGVDSESALVPFLGHFCAIITILCADPQGRCASSLLNPAALLFAATEGMR